MQGTTTLHWYQCLVLSISILVPNVGNDEYYCDVMDEKDISIHVPYTGNDDTASATELLQRNFNPRSLYRERREFGVHR